MKIAFLNPWKDAAENQAFRSLEVAANRIGHEMVHCSDSDCLSAAAPDFVLAASSTQPKLNDIPHYGVIHQPRDRLLCDPGYFNNFLSYDGYLTISDSLARFVRDVTQGVGRPMEPGFYYNTCQRQQRTTDLPGLISAHALKITYFGTNWDKRREKILNRLSENDGIEICGPQRSWPGIAPSSYGGALTFDGDSVQARYAINGAGLCLLSDDHLGDDVISNRIFEIASVGAVAICCDIPWIRKYFGDSVYYIDQNLSDHDVVGEILARRDEIYADPEGAMEKALHARQIFESRFSAEVLLQNAIDYHLETSRRKCERRSRAVAGYEPLISVIIRCGSRPVETLKRAIQSVAAQTYGRFEIIFVRFKDLCLDELTSSKFDRIQSFRVIDVPGGTRCTNLWRGLSCVRGDYFAVLDDDDWLFSNHFESLLSPFPQCPQRHFFAYSGVVVSRNTPSRIDGGGSERRTLAEFGINGTADICVVSRAFTPNCFVASSDLLQEWLLVDPKMTTAEDSCLILSLLSQAKPHFSFAATAVYEQGMSEQSSFSTDPNRFEDELSLRLRVLARFNSGIEAIPGASFEAVLAHWSRRSTYGVEASQPTTPARQDNESDHISGFLAKVKGVLLRAAGNDPVITVWVPIPQIVRRTLRFVFGIDNQPMGFRRRRHPHTS